MSNLYCSYLTIYYGNKLPPFYIGSSSIERISNGYHGSVSSKEYHDIWVNELSNHPDLFKTKILKTFYTRKEAFESELKFQKYFKVVKNSMYINLSVATVNGFKGRDVSGKNNPRYGVIFSKETRDKISKGNKDKIRSESNKIAISNGLKSFYKNPIEIKKIQIRSIGSGNPNFGKLGEDSPNFGRKNSQETKDKMSKAASGKIRSIDHCIKLNRTYVIESEDGTIFTGYGLSKFCAKHDIKVPSFMYTMKSQKFMKGFRILRKIENQIDSVCLDLF